jgi:hypothetical protein
MTTSKVITMLVPSLLRDSLHRQLQKMVNVINIISNKLLTHLATLYSFRSTCSKSAHSTSLLDYWVKRLKTTVLAATPFYILGSTENDPPMH